MINCRHRCQMQQLQRDAVAPAVVGPCLQGRVRCLAFSNTPPRQHGHSSLQVHTPTRSTMLSHRSRMVCLASDSASAAAVRKELPIFPLSVVALPHSRLPLMIFEPRYRVLFNTLLDGDEGVEEGLVQKDSPFAGSRKFGMCFLLEDGKMATIGTTLEIEQFVLEEDGRMYVTQKGIERFKIKKVVKEKPVLICEVEVLSEDDDTSEEVVTLSKEVADLFRNTLRLHHKVNRVKAEKTWAARQVGGLITEAEDDPLEPEELTTLPPSQLSYWVAHVFAESRMIQQALLEEDSTKERLLREKEVLSTTMKFYSAASALEGVFSSSGGSSESGSTPPPGGPD